MREFGGLGVLRLLRSHDALGAGVDLLLGSADVLAEGLGGGAQPGLGSLELIGEVGVGLVGGGELLIGRGNMVLQAVAPNQPADTNYDGNYGGNGDCCNKCYRGGSLGYYHWFCFAHVFSLSIRR